MARLTETESATLDAVREPAHTPGPWIVVEGDEWLSVALPDADLTLLADVLGWRPEDGPARGWAECLANARLMAAGPQLLAACWSLLQVAATANPSPADRAAALDAGRTAIAAATQSYRACSGGRRSP